MALQSSEPLSWTLKERGSEEREERVYEKEQTGSRISNYSILLRPQLQVGEQVKTEEVDRAKR